MFYSRFQKIKFPNDNAKMFTNSDKKKLKDLRNEILYRYRT